MNVDTGTPKMWSFGYRPGLDGLRGVAVLLVLADHLRLPLASEWGSVGVTLFFVLSGFLITSLLFKEWGTRGRVDLVAFYQRRALRLFPALFTVCGLVALSLVVTGDGNRVFPEVGGALSYLANWLRIGGVDMGVMSHTWSLAVEEQFYLVWPLALLLFVRTRLAVPFILSLILMVVALRVGLAATGVDDLRLRTGTDLAADALLGGCLLAFVLGKSNAIAPRWALFAGLGALAVALCAGYADLVESVGMAATTIGGVLLVWYLATSNASAFNARPIVEIGRISYGIYLWHAPIIAAMTQLPAAVILVVILGVATLSYRFIEAPFLRLKRRPVPAMTERPGSR